MTYDKRKVTIIIPVKNEAEGLASILRSVKPFASHIIAVDGHSTDETEAIIRSGGATYLLDHGVGKGEAVRFALTKVKTDIVVTFDADGSHEASDIPVLVEPIIKGKAELVIGSRRTGGSFDVEPTFDGLVRSAGSDLLTYLLNRRFHTRFTDVLYSLRAIRTKTAKRLDLTANGFDLDQEMVAACLQKGYRVAEIPSQEHARAWGATRLKTIDGIRLLFHLVKKLYF